MLMRHLVLTFSLLGLISVSLHAQEAQLSASTTSPVAGQVFTLSIEAESRRARSPGILDIPGLSVLSQSESTSVSIINGQVSASTTFDFQVIAEKEGPLEVEGIELEIDGQKVKTNSLKLDVQKARGRAQSPQLRPGVPAPPGSRPGTPNTTPAYPTKIDDETAFLKVIPARDEIYAGETAEVEIKAYLDAGIPLVNFARELNLQSEDFIFQPTVGPDVQKRQRGMRVTFEFQQESIDGRLFNVLTYKTTVTAVKPGSFELPSVDFMAIIELPRQNRQQRRRPRSRLDSLFGDPFDDPFFDNMLNSRKRELRLRSEPVKLEVLPLPSEGRPAHFTGAIGRFSLDVKADKEELEVGEALEITATVTGHGNFERIGELDSDAKAQWKAYPPKIHFHSADDLKLSGEKKFEYTYIATGPTTESPVTQFSYFDPEEKKYVNLGGDSLPVHVTGTASPAITNQDLAVLADQTSESGPKTLAAIAASPSLQFFRGNSSSFLGASSLLAINGTAAAVALALLAWRWRRQEGAPTPKKRRKILRKERENLEESLPSAEDPAAFDRQFLRYLALHHHLNAPENAVETDDWEAARRTVEGCPAGSQPRLALEDFLDWANARRWSGKIENDAGPAPERRDNWLHALAELPHR